MYDYISPDNKHSALIIIDMQRDFTLPTATAVIPGTIQSVPKIQSHTPFPTSEAIRQAVNVLNAPITIDSYYIPIIIFAQSYSQDQDYLMSVITIRCPVFPNNSCLNMKIDSAKTIRIM